MNLFPIIVNNQRFFKLFLKITGIFYKNIFQGHFPFAARTFSCTFLGTCSYFSKNME